MTYHRTHSRRAFLKNTVALAAVSGMSGIALPALASKPVEQAEPRFKKAVKIGMVKTGGSLTDKFKLLKRLGFDGIELTGPGGPSADEVAKAMDASGLPVHGVVDSVHWKDTLSHPDKAVRQRGTEALKGAIVAAKSYGATSVLLVPAKVDKLANYDQCWQRSIIEIKKALPLAEELGIRVLMENVWNDFLTDPKETARYIDELDSPMAGAYFGVGNAVRYSPPHQWIPILGKRIGKLDIKEFSLTKMKKENNNYAGFRVKLLEGECQWPKVIAALKQIDYRGWGTAEVPGGNEQRLADIAARMDKIFAS